MDDRCELVRLNDLERLYDVKRALETRGVDAEVWGNWSGSWRCSGSGELRLMVRQRDLVYARWVACAAGVDTWPDETGDDEGSEARARLPLGRAG
jgi:hypothetical protein